MVDQLMTSKIIQVIDKIIETALNRAQKMSS